MEFLVTIHGLVRWLVLLATVIGIVFYAMVWQRGLRAPQAERIVMQAFTGLIDLQVLIGIILIIFGGNFNGTKLAHGIVMIVAAGVAHSAARFRGLPSQQAARMYVLTMIGTLILILIGLTILMQRMFA